MKSYWEFNRCVVKATSNPMVYVPLYLILFSLVVLNVCKVVVLESLEPVDLSRVVPVYKSRVTKSTPQDHLNTFFQVAGNYVEPMKLEEFKKISFNIQPYRFAPPIRDGKFREFHALAKCYEGKLRIDITRKSWAEFSDLKREQLIHREVGICIMSVKKPKLGFGKNKTSVMSVYLAPDKVYAKHRPRLMKGMLRSAGFSVRRHASK